MNITWINVNGTQRQVEARTNKTDSAEGGETGLDAFMYIVVVMMFYATAMVVLVVKYLHGEKREASLRRLYKDFIDREEFLESHSMSEKSKAVHMSRQRLRSIIECDNFRESKDIDGGQSASQMKSNIWCQGPPLSSESSSSRQDFSVSSSDVVEDINKDFPQCSTAMPYQVT